MGTKNKNRLQARIAKALERLARSTWGKQGIGKVPNALTRIALADNGLANFSRKHGDPRIMALTLKGFRALHAHWNSSNFDELDKMLPLLLVVALLLPLAACGGLGSVTPGAGWRNETQGDLTDAQLDYHWKLAQDSIGMRPWTQYVGSSVKHNPDTRAYELKPDGLRVIVHFENDGKWFAMDCGCTDGKCFGCYERSSRTIHYASAVKQVLYWEMGTDIVLRLGYDVRR
jgi:hypothetical protein